MKSVLSIPCHWNIPVLKQILDLNTGRTDIAVGEIYGVFPTTLFGHGRAPSSLKSLSLEEAKNFREVVASEGVLFSYLMNSPISEPFISKRRHELLDHLDYTLEELHPDSLVIASYDLMKLVREHNKNIPIFVSTISRVSKPSDIDRYLDINPRKIIVQHDVNRDFHSLIPVVEKCSDNDIDVVVMLTESCLRRCPYMINHYIAVGQGHDDALFHARCNELKVRHPKELLKTNFIRPEDIEIYESLGIKHFKITGRSKPAEWLPLVVESYLDRSFNGNLIRLSGIDPAIAAEERIYIDNKSLDGFLNGFPRTGNPADEDRYCNNWILKLFRDGKFKIKGIDYDIIDNELVTSDAKSVMMDWYGGKNE